MKKIQNLNELKNLQKADLINEMLKGTIKGGSSCGGAGPSLSQRAEGSDCDPW